MTATIRPVDAPEAERDAETPPPSTAREGRTGGRGRRGRRGRGLALGAALLALVIVLVGHGGLPDLPGHLSSLAETLLPWTALAIPALAAPALLRRSRTATAALILPVAAWLTVFAGTLADKSAPGGDLTVVSHNVNQDNPDPSGTARSLIASGADIVALQELSPDTAPAYERALAAAYPHHFQEGTVGLWSTRPLRDARAVPIMPWTRALRATADTPEGPLAVYVAHLPSVRVGPAGFTSGSRDDVAGVLAGYLRAERVPRVLVMGDFNGSTDDRGLRPLTAGMASAQSTSGEGFGLTWPASLPLVRIDQILLKGARATGSWTLPATASDHLPVAARVDLGPGPATPAGARPAG
ncbi:endonuclease/exonuclease/phosphatase family protein [Streptomyces sp. NPDC092046]|uniref:endonuclease/exonuclease/phosphatase family protein n=1 Tax=Streptomyces sp. NPDC092046 TaxID=3366009 RepID=UPI003803163E